MPLTRLDNLISSKTGKYLYVSPDDFNATDALSNRGNSPVTPFKSIQRAFLEIARYSYLPGFGNDRFDQFSIMLMPGIHYIDNRPGLADTSAIDIFGFDTATNAWTDDSILDISNPDNIFWKFNNTEGGAIIPRGSSLVGYDLRRTVVRPMYVPDPAVTEREIPRSAIFNVTGGCYFWQFTIKDGQTTSESPLYDNSQGTGLVYYDPKDFTRKAAPNYSHHKLTVFEYADTEELSIFYRKIAKAFSAYQPTIDDPGEFDFRVQENRIVGPLSDSRVIESLKITDATTDSSIPASTSEIEVTTKVDHGYFQGQFVAIANTEIDDVLEGIFQIKEIDQNDARKFTYEVPFVASAIGTNINSGKTVSVDSTPALGQNAQTLAEVDSVESASPYVFNVSIRSTWGICGIWANGLKATGFKSMVIAQYTGVSLQKDDRAFIRYDEYTNTWNQASLVDAFATVPYHTKGDSYWKDEWRNFHVRASEDAFIQNVSIFAVGFADHFLMESGGDMSITNSNSNFGNTSLHAIGFKGFAFNQDKGGYITDIVPPQVVTDNQASTKKINYYTIDIQGTLKTSLNYTKLFLGSDEIKSPLTRPAATITGYRIGAKSDDKLYVKLDKAAGTDEFFNAQLEPTGFVKYVAKGSILNPSGGVVNSVYADAANLIESNRRMIQEEVFGYILEKYPRLQNIPYVNPGLNPAGNRYFDARNLIAANRQEIVDTAFDDMIRTYGSGVIQGIGDGKCKRDIGLVVDAVAEDLKDGGNANIIAATRTYFDGDGNPLANGLVGEETYATYAFRRARDLCKQAIANLLTVKADLYDPDPNSNLAPYGINVGKTGSQAELDGDTTNGVTIDLALKADPASRYKDARNRIVANREFILDAALAEVSVYHPDFYIPGDTQTNAQSRLADAFRMIRRNSSEIRDKALASIVVSHPDFYIPGDNQTDGGSRFADSYRLIAQNRDQIVDTALAQITIGHPDFYIPGDAETDARSRYADGYRLIQQNRTEIVNAAWAVVNANPPSPAPTALEAKCKRDIGLFIDAVSLDLFVGGNKYSRKFISEYFDATGNNWISGGLQGETTESIAAFNEARDQMGLAVANQLSIQDLTVTEGPAQYGGGGGNVSRTNSGACDDVQSAIDTLTNIVTTQIANGNLSALPAETPYEAGPGESKCRRDIGIFVDSLALDLFMQGNVYTHRFAAEYFENATTPIANGVVGEEAPTITTLNKAAEMIKKAITNQLYEKDLTITADNAPGSDYGQVTKQYTPHGVTYDPATGVCVFSVANHGLSAGDRIAIADNSITFTCTMDGNSTQHTVPGASSTLTWGGLYINIDSVTADTITCNVGASGPNVQFTPASGTTYDPATGLLVMEIGAHTLSVGEGVVIADNSLTFTCTQDGNTSNETYPRPSDPASGNSVSITAVTATTITVNVGASPVGQQYPHTFISATANAVSHSPQSAHTFVSAATNAITFAGNTANQFNAQEFLCSDVQSAVDSLTSIATTIIANGNLSTMPIEVNYGTGMGPGEMKCARDIGYFIDAISVDMFCEGNRHTKEFTRQYFTNATTPLSNGLVGEEAESVTAFNTAINVMKQAITNQLYYKDLTVTPGPASYGGSGGDIDNNSTAACADVQTALDTLGTIVTDAITAGNITGGIWNSADNTGTFITGEAKCRRDLGIVVDAVAQDLWFGGNEFTIAATKEYFNGNTLISNGVDNEVGPSITAFKRAEDLMQRALNNVYYDRDLNITLDQIGDPPIVGDIECDAHDMVIDNLDFIAEEAYLRMLAAYPTYTPQTDNTAQDCKDDVVSVLREVMWDVKFGGNYKTYDAAKIYVTNYDYRDGTTVETFIDAERDEAAKVMLEAKNIAMQVIKNETVSVSAGNTLTQKIDTTIVDDWDADELLPKCGSAVAAVDTLMGVIIQAIGTDAGVGNLDGVVRTTPDSPDPAWNTPLNILSVTATSITVNTGASQSGEQYPHTFVAAQAGAVVSGGDYPHTFVSAAANAVNVVNGSPLTPTNATYDATTGLMVMYFGTAHGLTTSNVISLDDNSFTFSCGMGRTPTTKTYPRPGSDPQAGQNITIQSVTDFSITIDVGTSPLVEWNVSNAVYDPVTGSTALTIGAHNLEVGTSIKLKEESLIFKCTKDQNVTTHAYPRAAGKYQPTAYAEGNCSDVLATVNALVDIVCNSLNEGNLDNLPPLNNGEWDCANVRGSIETLFDILQDAIIDGTLAGLPPLNTGDFTINNEASKCFRDVTYIVDAIVNDLRLGGNINSIQAGEAYYVGNNLEYIDGEKTETLDAWNYVGQMATAAMRNFDVLAYNCSTTAGSAIVDVNDTRGIIIGMSVKEYDNSDPVNPAYVNGLLQDGSTQVVSNIPAGTYVKRIVSNTEIELGVNGSRLTEGNTVNALQTSTTTELYFVYEKGIWADTEPNTVTVGPENEGPDVIQDTLTSETYRECSGTADAIETLVGVITTIINSGLGTVSRSEQTVNTALLASRATVFTIDTGGGASDPHKFETGTPVRLVPRPRFDTVTGKYVDVDKRLVRLPNGFETNRTYYVIAPGRSTAAGGEDYSGTSFFNGSDQTRLMLATSKENAAAGIYIYASETDAIDDDVEIDIYQFVLDDKYDLHQYRAFFSSTVTNGIETDVPHIFDVPTTSLSSVEAQKVFIRSIEGSRLPIVANQFQSNPNVAITDTSNSEVGRINPNVEFFVRYQNSRTITIHETYADAINNANPIVFAAGQSALEFDVFANKRRSPMRFDPGFTDNTTTTGKWYIQCKDEVTGSLDPKDNIFWRISQTDYADRQRSTDMWYERLEDNRDKDERTYKIRYVIPKDLENARDPISGFVLKTRTDDTRKLVPQKVLLKPVVGNVFGARFENPVQAGEIIGWTEKQIKDNGLSISTAYDPYKKDQTGAGLEYRAFARFNSGVQATIQSARYVPDILDDNKQYLELTLFDHGIDTKNFPGLRNETFTTVKITAPQGGIFVTSKTDNQAADPNAVSFAGNSSGLANIHGYFTVGGDHYLIIKNIRGGVLEYSEYANTRFTQGTVFADMLEDQDMGKSLPLKTQIAKNNPQFFYKQNGANVYTITPGDRIQDDAGVEYYVDSVEDAGIIEDTFYIFGYETLQRRITGQQDGIYYITALRGNISPFPTGAGVTNNFKKFKFSQPVSKLYPLNFRNDPLWFKNSGTSAEEKAYYASLIDPPATFSAADNYIHGLVSVNDFKGSTTREMVLDLTEQSAFANNSYTNTTVSAAGDVIDNRIQAKEGNATSGSEDRLIPIAGDNQVYTDQKYYVELRRPSIARAGNHTFEYLGFGPGNYSTGLPARQEVVLTPDEDFYAQSKKQDGGIVFYTGINSQGDLYIGNRRINAITGEETFIDRATLADDGDEDDTIGGLVTTFDTPVTFNQNITVVGGDGELVNNFESPVTISVQDEDLTQQRHSLIIKSIVTSIDPVTQLQQDESLDRTAFTPTDNGDIRLSKNRVDAAIFAFNARGNGQRYLFQTHTLAGVPSNATPNMSPLVSAGGSTLDASQTITYGGVLPYPGDVLLKGQEVGKNGSIGWVLANYFQTIANNSIDNIVFDGSNVVKLEFRDFNSGSTLKVGADIGINSGSQIRIKNFYYDERLNLTWTVFNNPQDPFDPDSNYCYFQVVDQIPQDSQPWETIIAGTAAGSDAPSIEFSNSNFKEVGVIGGEALRTETETIGDYKLGINTVARSPHSAYQNAFVDNLTTDPRANLDVVGTAFISGRTTGDYLQHTDFADRDKTAENNAFLVGGDSATPDNEAVLRVATTNGGRVGINVDNSQLDRALVVDGTSRFTDDARFEHDIEVNGDDGTTAEIRTSQTTGTFNLVNDSTFTGTLNFVQNVETINIGNTTTADQFINIGRGSLHSNIYLGVTPDTPATNISKVEIGGAYLNTNEDLSYTKIKTRNFRVDGDMWLGFRRGIGDSVSLKSQASQVDFFSNTGGPSILNFALNASEINIAGQGGKTTINNQLEVIASATFQGDITMCGGVASFSFDGARGQMGTDPVNHDDGVLSDSLFNKNIDILNVLVKLTTEEGYNQVDTAGSGNWGGAAYQQAVNIGGTIEPTELTAITGDEFYLPLKNQPLKLNGDPYFATNDYIIVDSAVVGSGSSATSHPEILQITELTRINAAPYYIKVKRRPFGAFGGVLENHADTTPVYKVNVQFDATWTEQSLDNTGPNDNVYLAEFGGALTNNDYVIIDRDDSPKVPEYIKVVAALEANEQKFIISSDCSAGSAGDVFVVNSVTGDTTILGNTVINNTLTLKGGCGTANAVQITGDIESRSRVISNVTVTSANKTLADIKVGDSVKIITDSCPVKVLQDTEVDFVFGGAIYLNQPFIGASSATNVSLVIERDERLTLTDGVGNQTFDVNTCSGTTEIGTYAGRFDVGLAWSSNSSYTTTAAIESVVDLDDVVAYGYYIDPQTIQSNGPATTIRAATATGTSPSLLQIPVQSAGEGSGRFAVGDIIAVGPTASFTGAGQLEFLVVDAVIAPDSDIPTLVAQRAQEGTVAMNHNVGDSVRRIIKHKDWSRVNDAEIRQRQVSGAPVDYLSVIIEKGYISQQKLDYKQWLRFSNKSNNEEVLTVVNGRLFGKVHESVMDEQLSDGAKSYRQGSLNVTDNLTLGGGNFIIYDSVRQTELFKFTNDDGHADHQGLLNWDAGVIARGDFFLYPSSCPENVITTLSCDPSFSIDNLGNGTIKTSLTITGEASATPGGDAVLSVQNLGINGGNSFDIKRDQSIDAFGLTNYYTSSGAKHTRYISAASPEADLQLISNIVYMVNVQSTQTLIVTLPSGAQTGDVVRLIDVGGNLKYDTTLVIRTPETSGTPIQGDNTGTLFGDRLTPYPSGELVVQTANAAFALIYLGSSDSNNQIGIPTSVQGWWLMEV